MLVRIISCANIVANTKRVNWKKLSSTGSLVVICHDRTLSSVNTCATCATTERTKSTRCGRTFSVTWERNRINVTSVRMQVREIHTSVFICGLSIKLAIYFSVRDKYYRNFMEQLTSQLRSLTYLRT
uniref:Uncharacterized protein n=1 Tax=Cacopsylla melanoneura TaxID=428564 RepID=A0A8D9BJD3_9HEMI